MRRQILQVLCALTTTAVCSAGVVDINLVELDLVFADGTLRDTNETGPAPVFITIDDGEPLAPGQTPATLEAMLDLDVPSIAGPSSGGLVQLSSSTPGSLELTLPWGEVISLDLDEIMVTHVDNGGLGYITFVSAMGNPTDPKPSDPATAATMILSSATTSDTQEGSTVTSFEAEGTGQLRGVFIIPEPASGMIVGLMAVLGSAAAVMRVNLG